MKVYIKVTRDRYEHIVAMADSPTALSRQLGLSRDTVASSLKRPGTTVTTAYTRSWR